MSDATSKSCAIVENPEGRPFYVRIVLSGDHYGLTDGLTNDGETMVEFYDYGQDKKKFSERGQFVARYYLSTLKDHGPHDLSMCMSEPVWWVSAENVRQAIELAEARAASGSVH